MSSTNYTVGFTIHDAKSLVTKGGNPVDPLVVVRCCGKEYSTDVKRGKTGVVSWDESCIWADIILNSQNWVSASIVFEVQAANAFWRNDAIGSCTLQLSMIHARRCHQVKRSLPLYIMNEPDPKGFLRITVYVIGPKDTPPSPNDQDSDDELGRPGEDIRQAVLDVIAPEKVPTSGKPYHLYVSVHRVEHLPKAVKGERDPFITCEFAGSKLKSSQARSTRNHSFNECFRIPVVTPVQQDAVILKLWDWNFLAADELLAYGRLSFAELRSRPVSIRWFNFYGSVKSDRRPHDSSRKQYSGKASQNVYLGRLQLSARAERLDRIENLMPAQVVAAEAVEEMSAVPMVLLPDVYEVTGVPGHEVCVEIWCGPFVSRTRWVERQTAQQETAKKTNREDTLDKSIEESNTLLQCFSFDQAQGRIAAMSLTVPEDEKQQWNILISVYARGGGFKEETRVSYHSLPLSSLPVFVDVNPRTPSWIPLRMMPSIPTINHSPVAVLITLERTTVEVARGKRKFVSFQDYELRCYVYAVRDLPYLKGYPANPAVRVCCAGVSGQTLTQSTTNNPVFMECLRLNCRLSTDPSSSISTVAPITITVIDIREGSSTSSKDKAAKSDSEITSHFMAHATCHYDRIRMKPREQEVAQPLNPRWIEMKGGPNLDERAGDVLVCFELVRKKDAAKIFVLPMRPELVRCSLTVSIAGLRDLILAKSQAGFLDWLLNQDAHTSMQTIRRPLVLVSVSVFEVGCLAAKNGILIPWNPTVPNDPLNKNKNWQVGVQASYDFFQSMTLDCFLPRDPIFDPKLTVLAYNRKIKRKYFVGGLTLDLATLLPWVKDLDAVRRVRVAYKDFTETVNLKKLGEALLNIRAGNIRQKKGFINLGLDILKSADEEAIHDQQASVANSSLQAIVESKFFSPSGVPTLLLESYAAIRQHRLPVAPIVLNMFTLNVFIPSRFVLAAHGVMAEKRKKEECFRPSVEGILENFILDFVWENHKFQKKIDKKLMEVGSIQLGVAVTAAGEMRSSLSNELATLVQDNKKFRQRFRGPKSLPSLIRLRVYVMRAITLTPVGNLTCINPFLVFKMGSKSENLRGNAKSDNANPEFCWSQECDITLPEQTRLEIAVWSRHQSVSGNDVFIGSTVIDLESRWFSKEWQKLVARSSVPLEYRPLYPMGDTSNSRLCGTLEMWVEMLSPQKALEIPRVVLKEATPVGVELRVVVWGARALSLKRFSKDYVDVQISATLDCSGYKGTNNVTQSTDVHYHSRNGNAIFNWRFVYPNIRLPLTSCVLQLVAYDFHSISSSVFIGEVNIELRTYIEKVGLALSSQEYDAEFSLVNRKYKTESDCRGFVQVTIQIIPQQEAASKQVGLGREAPNRDPHLTTPLDGRKWEDFIRAVSFNRDFSKIMYKVRIIVTVALFFALFIISFLYPGLFFQ